MARSRRVGALAAWILGSVCSAPGLGMAQAPDARLMDEAGPLGDVQAPDAGRAGPAEPGLADTARSGARELGSGLSAPRPEQRMLAVMPTAVQGVDPVVGEHVTSRIRLTAGALGYALAGPEETAEAAGRLRVTPPLSPADLWRLGYIVRSERVIGARVWAEHDQYVVEVVVASLDGTGPFRGRESATAAKLHEAVAALVLRLLPPPMVWDAETAASLRAQAASGQPLAQAPRSPVSTEPVDRRPSRRFDLALQTDSAIGTTNERFYNHLLGMRVGVRITRTLLLGGYFGYANLAGRNTRANNLVGYLQFENRVRVVGVPGLSVPLRVGVGYLPFNGPLIRAAAGVNYALSDRWEIGADFLAPTFWFTGDSRPVTFNLALEVIYRLGR